MRRISYAEQVMGTDERVGALLIQYAAMLARSSSADTVSIPCRIGTQEIESVSVLIGPASQMASWSDDEPFEADVSAAVADLEHRIASLRGRGDSGPEAIGPGAIDEFDELA